MVEKMWISVDISEVNVSNEVVKVVEMVQINGGYQLVLR